MSEEETQEPVVYDQATQPEATPAEETYTQADVERIVKSRFKKFEDYEQLQAKAAKLDEIEAANKSELEKLMERAERAERERDEVAKKATQQAVKSAIVAEASRQGAIDPEDIVALIDVSSVVDEDGNVSDVAAAVKSLLEAKPHLAGTRTPKPVDQGARASADEKSDPALAIGRHILESSGR